MNGPHALTRAEERLIEAGLDPVKVHAKAKELAEVTSRYWQSAAVLMVSLDRICGDDRDDVLSRQSNGDEVWAVLREGHVATIMLRRSNQPKRPDAFGVEKVLRMTK